MSDVCPLCQTRCSRVITNPYLHPLAVDLALRVDSAWTLEAGCCDRCFGALQENAYRAEAEQTTATSEDGFRDHHRYVLGRRDRNRWFHCNETLRDPFRRIIQRSAAEEALRAGKFQYLVIDGQSEALLSSGMMMVHEDEE